MCGIAGALQAPSNKNVRRMSMAFGLEARVPFLDVKAVALALGFPPGWKLHEPRVPKDLLRKAFAADLPAEIVNRPKQKFSSGADSSDLIAQQAEAEISDEEFAAESIRLKSEWDHPLQNKEALYYYKILQEHYADEWIFPTMGTSRSL